MYLREKFRIQFWLGVTISFSQLPGQKKASFSAKSCPSCSECHNPSLGHDLGHALVKRNRQVQNWPVLLGLPFK
jgi:hypothetical protein